MPLSRPSPTVGKSARLGGFPTFGHSDHSNASRKIELAPFRILVLAYLVDPISPLQVTAIREAAPALGITPLVHDIHSADDLPSAFEAGMKDGAQALTTTAESIFRAQRAKVTELAAHYKLPAIYPYAAFALDSGGLMAYEVYDSDLHRNAADYGAIAESW
jgi:putative tryptophan/tyrosine transport system substrate-binding protein